LLKHEDQRLSQMGLSVISQLSEALNTFLILVIARENTQLRIESKSKKKYVINVYFK
jgi:hypothetical protein